MGGGEGGGEILEEVLLRGSEGFFLGGLVARWWTTKTRKGPGRPSVVLGPERLTHSRHNKKIEMAIRPLQGPYKALMRFLEGSYKALIRPLYGSYKDLIRPL